MEKTATFLLRVIFLTGLYVFATTDGFAQISHLSPGDVKAQTKKSQKEAARLAVDNKETHLATENFVMKKGESGRKKVRVAEEPAEYVYDQEKNAITEPAKEPAKKKEPAKGKKKEN